MSDKTEKNAKLDKLDKHKEEIKHLMHLSLYAKGNLDKLYETYAKYKDTEVLRKAIACTIDSYTQMNAVVVGLISSLTVESSQKR